MGLVKLIAMAARERTQLRQTVLPSYLNTRLQGSPMGSNPLFAMAPAAPGEARNLISL